MEDQGVVFLRGPQVVLRPNLQGDDRRLVRWINDPEVRYFLDSYLPFTDTEEEAWLIGIGSRKPNNIILAIEVDGVHVGQTGLHRINWRDRRGTTGTMIGEKNYWGKGIGTEAKMLLLHYAFSTLNLRKICSTVLKFNQRSLAVQRKCGYKKEGVSKDHFFRDGKYWDLVLLAVFAEDFSPIWKKWSKSTPTE